VTPGTGNPIGQMVPLKPKDARPFARSGFSCRTQAVDALLSSRCRE
jgi:hypothetical protein